MAKNTGNGEQGAPGKQISISVFFLMPDRAMPRAAGRPLSAVIARRLEAAAPRFPRRSFPGLLQ